MRNPKLLRMNLGLFVYYFFLYQVPQDLGEKRKAKRSCAELTYGETPFFTLQKLLLRLPLSGSDIRFCDLGCGRGKLVLYLAMLYGWESVGVDVIATYIKHSEAVAGKYGLDKASFIEQDFTDVELGNFDLIYLIATCLEDATLEHMKVRFADLQRGCFVICVSRPLDCKHLKPIICLNSAFSWGMENVYIYQKD